MGVRIALVWVLLSACGNEAGDDSQDMPDAPTGNPGEWSTLISKSWSLPPNSENTSDIQIITVDRDIVIGGMRPLAPVGTHHTVLFRGIAGTNAIYASGVGTGELVFPPGKGLRLTQGTAVGLQLHIYNTSDDMLEGLSGVEILEVESASVTEEVDLFLPGPRDLAITPGTHTHAGTCTVAAPQTIFALFPHMHQYGSHFKTTLTVGGTDQVLHDAAYDFEHQEVKTFTPIALAIGDKITTECTWTNTTNANIGYGESSDTEMCYSILYRYPKQNNEFCTQ